tara:strand:+ start:338 stop:1195 length:858 start_codon:yes stop_codon:yes gene_type:complete
MATVTKAVLKTYFEQGDIPTQAQYVDLIDSQFGLGELGTQIIEGTISASQARIEYISLKKLSLTGIGISSDGTDGAKVGSTFTIGRTLEITGDINSTGIISGSSINSTNITATGTLTAGATSFTTVDTGQGATEVHLMNQNVKTTSAVTFATVDTGQGANELYDMNQNVTNSSVVQFAGITLTKSTSAGGSYGGTINSSGQSFRLTLTDVPEIPGRASGLIAKSTPTIIINPQVVVTSVILATVASVELSVNAFKVTNGSFEISLGNEAAGDFVGGNVDINFTIF